MQNMQIKLSKNNDKKCNLIIIGFFEKTKPDFLHQIDSSLKPLYENLKKKEVFTGKANEQYLSITPSKSPDYAFMGLGEKNNFSAEKFRNTIGQIINTYSGKFKILRIIFKSFDVKNFDESLLMQELTEIVLISKYRFNNYLTKKDGLKTKSILEIFHPSFKESLFRSILIQSQNTAQGINTARNLGNEPGNIMTPAKLMTESKKITNKQNLNFECINKTKLKKLGMGGILSVSQGSTHDPFLFSIKKKQNKAKNKTVVLVGKGVTFDSGGISIKPANSMADMKYDMCGAAIVIGIMQAIAKTPLNVNVIGIVPAVENNIGADPQRPGDIIKTFSGKTVEVLNTDAEGRLILADALYYSKIFKPDFIIDFATLTGAMQAALGDKAAGIFSLDAKFAKKLISSGEKTGEKLWPMPMWEEYEAMIKSKVADIKNLGGPYAGSITAALFLKEFIPSKTPWCHIDIAGVSWNIKGRNYMPEGASGFGIRLVVDFLKNL